MRSRALIGLLVVATTVACGGSKGGNDLTGPSGTQPTSLSITPGADLVTIRGTETFTVTATFSNGSTGPVGATWSSDNTSVASVESGGRVTGAGPGRATISASYSGMQATRQLRVVPDYAGRWTGDAQVTGCGDDGDWRRVGFCADVGTGGVFPTILALTQDRDHVTGTGSFDEMSGPVQGAIRTSGHIGLDGSFTVTVEGVPFEVTVLNWETLSTDNQRMTGRYALSFRATALQGSARIDAELRNVGKSASGVVGSESLRPGVMRRSLHRVVRAR
jgi:hypothetical protein